MARPRKNAGEGSALSAGQASYVLDRLISERRISQGEINRYVDEMSVEISQLEQRLARLREAAGPAAAALAGLAAGVAGSAIARRRRGRSAGKRGPGRPPGKRGPGRPPASASASSAPSKGGAKRRRRSAITAEQLASRQLQGRYLALVRQFAASRRPAFAKIAKERGREAAIREMQDSLRK
jgi:hypothetical protein